MSAFPSVPRALTRASPRHRLLALTAVWLLTRALMLWLLAHDTLPLLGHGAVAREVWKLYQHWYVVLSHGAWVAYPTPYHQVAACTWTGCVLMLIRNGLLAATTVVSTARLWRPARPAAPGRRPEQDQHRLRRGTPSPS
jgi:hypothetical protein